MATSFLRKRVLSAALLLPLAILAIVVGFPFFDLLCAIAAMLMAWEWIALCTISQKENANLNSRILELLSVGSSGGILLLSSFAGIPFYFSALLTFIAATLLALGLYRSMRTTALWLGLGILYATLPSLALIWIRADPAQGLALTLWILGLTVTADTLAYAMGRLIGGPKLAPKISPKKTWAGLGGAILGAGLAGAIGALWVAPQNMVGFIILSSIFGVIEQAGDLAESAMKRHFGVKDSGWIIPGHGGILDRVDGLVAVVLLAAVIHSFGGLLFFS